MANTGVFHIPGKSGGGCYRAPGRAHNSPLAKQRAAERKARIDEFADALAEDFTVAEACELVGVQPDAGKRYLREIRAGLEAQAI